jgi:DNA repair exonuclease SbcCD ATPase subunit
MITEIRMDSVASFSQPSSLMTDKKINIIYGLNGAGKSTLLYHTTVGEIFCELSDPT